MQEMSSLVSIVMPCYKAAATLSLAVQGIQAQSYRQWELLLVVDGSHDATAELAGQLAEADARIRLVLSTKNRGVVRARNLGIRLAKGNWLAFCDADDFWQPHKLAAQLALADQTSANLLCSTFWYWYPHRQKDRLKMVRLPKHLRYQTMLRTNAIPMSTAMYGVGALGKQYFEALPSPYIHEDYAYWLRIMQNPKVMAESLQKPTALIRVQPNSRSANKWLALRSHAYILTSVAGLSTAQQTAAMFSYVIWGFLKRWSIQNQPFIEPIDEPRDNRE